MRFRERHQEPGGTDLDYAALKAMVPPHVDIAYDGMRLIIG